MKAIAGETKIERASYWLAMSFLWLSLLFGLGAILLIVIALFVVLG